MSTKRERRLRNSGYQFSGHYFRYGERQAALEKAAEYRSRGYRAQVLTVISPGQIYSSEGYSVFVKPVQPTIGHIDTSHL